MDKPIEHLLTPTGAHIMDGVSIAVVLGTFANLLPPLAALATLIWTCIRIYETDTIQRWLGKKK